MKKLILPCLFCALFCLVLPTVGVTFCQMTETIEFCYNNKVFNYNLSNNIKTSTQFDLNYEINKYNRFGTQHERINLLNKMNEMKYVHQA